MPILKTRAALKLKRSIRLLINTGMRRGGLGAAIDKLKSRLGIETTPARPAKPPTGGARDVTATPQPERGTPGRRKKLAAKNQKLKRVRRQLAEKDREIAELRKQLASRVADSNAADIKPENLVWLFGSGRTGNSWLMSMMREIEGYTHWGEPLIGKLFGDLYRSDTAMLRSGLRDFILPAEREDLWREALRCFVLESARARFEEARYLLVSDPNGSAGAVPLLKALPESRLIVLVRDPRDVVASFLDAYRKGGWLAEHAAQLPGGAPSLADDDPDAFVRQKAHQVAQELGWAWEAHLAHRGAKALIRYEDLRSDTRGVLGKLYGALGLPAGEEELDRVVQEHSWENVPAQEKGRGKFHRKASPGSWREDLTPEQARMVERITAPLLEQFYS